MVCPLLLHSADERPIQARRNIASESGNGRSLVGRPSGGIVRRRFEPGEARDQEAPLVPGFRGEQARVYRPDLLRLILVANGKNGDARPLDTAVKRSVGPLTRLVRRACREVQDPTTHGGDVFNLGFVEMPAQHKVNAGLELGFYVRALAVMKPVERMVHERQVQLGTQLLQHPNRGVQAAAPDPELRVVVVILAEERTVDGQDADLAGRHFGRFHRTAGGIRRERPDAIKIAV